MQFGFGRTIVRYGYFPFMVIGLNGAAYFVVANGHSYAWLAPLLALAFATSHIAERALPFHEEWNHSHGDEPSNALHTIVYEGTSLAGIMMIPFIAWLFSLKPGGIIPIWPQE